MNKLYTLILTLFLSFSLLAQVDKKVIIEHFTNTKCGICASKNPALYQTLEEYPQTLHIAYHPSAPYSSCIFSQHNPVENDDRANYYGVFGGTPRAVIQGDVLPIQTPLVKVNDIDSRLGMTSDFKVTISNTQVLGDNYSVMVEIERVSGNDGDEIIAYIGLAEKEIAYNAPNGEDIHHDVFRKMLYNETLDVNPIGNIMNIELDYSMHTDWISDQIYAYIVINKATSTEVLQSESSLTSPSSISDNSLGDVKTILFPNPVTSQLNIKAEYSNKVRTIELFSIVGNKVKELYPDTNMDVSDLPDGIYFAMITDDQNNQYTTRLIKSQ